MPDSDKTRRARPAPGGSHAHDLRFAGAVSAGLITAILAGGALLAPVTHFNNGRPALGSGDEAVNVKLPAAPPRAASRVPTRRPAAA